MDRGSGIAIDEDTKRNPGNVGLAPSGGLDGAGENDEGPPELTHQEPGYKKARWMRRRHDGCKNCAAFWRPNGGG